MAMALFGMSAGVAKCVAALTAENIDRIAARYGDELQVRWADRTLFWSLLLIAAKKDDRDVRSLTNDAPLPTMPLPRLHLSKMSKRGCY